MCPSKYFEVGSLSLTSKSMVVSSCSKQPTLVYDRSQVENMCCDVLPVSEGKLYLVS